MSPIAYDIELTARFFGLAMHPFDRLGLEGLLPHYHILSAQHETWLGALATEGVTSTFLSPASKAKIYPLPSLEHILQSPEIKAALPQKRLQSKTKSYLLPYKNDSHITTAARSLSLTLLANDYKTRWQLENKAAVRKKLGRLLPFPKYAVARADTLGETAADFRSWQKKYGRFVLQDEVLSSGKGTFLPTNEAEYRHAVRTLQKSPTHQVVISTYIPGDVTSIQVCLTRAGAFFSPIQQQIIGHPGLVRPFGGTSQFGGGQWNCRPYSAAVENQVATIVATLARELKGRWRGILGVDLIISPDERVYMLEINARLTGLSAPLALLQRHVSPINFLLLHVLELAHIPYTVTDPGALQKTWQALPCASYILPHNRLDQPVKRRQEFAAGVYKVASGHVTFQRPGYSFQHLQAADEVVIPEVPHSDLIIQPGERLSRILSMAPAVDSSGHLTPTIQQTVDFIEKQFSARSI